MMRRKRRIVDELLEHEKLLARDKKLIGKIRKSRESSE